MLSSLGSSALSSSSGSSVVDAGSSLIGSSKSEVVGSSADVLDTVGSSAAASILNALGDLFDGNILGVIQNLVGLF